MSLFSGPSLSFYLPGSNIKIAITTIRKYLSPKDVGKVHEIMDPVAASRGERGGQESHPHSTGIPAQQERSLGGSVELQHLPPPLLAFLPLLSSLPPPPVLFPPLPPPLLFGWFPDLILIARRFWRPRLQNLVSNIPQGYVFSTKCCSAVPVLHCLLDIFGYPDILDTFLLL